MNSWILAAAQPVAGAQTGGGIGTLLGGMLPMVLILVFFWVIVIMPQRKQQKQRDGMLKNLKKGDRVVTIGGMHGEVVEIGDDDVRLKVGDKIELKFSRSAVSQVKS